MATLPFLTIKPYARGKKSACLDTWNAGSCLFLFLLYSFIFFCVLLEVNGTKGIRKVKEEKETVKMNIKKQVDSKT